MKRAFFLMLAMAAASFSSGCHLCNYWHHGGGCHEGCGCQGGCDGHCAGCANGQCGECDGHPDPYEILHLGHQGPSQRSGVLSFLGQGGAGGAGGPGGAMGGAEAAQPAPGPSAGAVSYPYYTNRGPRDFLSPNPRGIGP